MKQILFFVIVNFFQSVWAEGNANPRISGQGLEKETSNDCDMTITDQFGDFRSPGYPGKYPRYSRCQYSIKRFSHHTCEVKLTLERFEITKMTFSNCSADFIEIQNGHKRYKLCGELSSGTKRFVMFPDDSDWLTFKFQSTFHQNRGFSIQVKQLPFSCKRAIGDPILESMRVAPPPCEHTVSGRIDRMSFPVPTEDDSPPVERCIYKIKKSEEHACIVQLDFSSFEVTQTEGCETDYLQLPDGQRLCGILGGSRRYIEFPPDDDELVFEFISSTDKFNSFDIQIVQLPGPCEPQLFSNSTRSGRASMQCDQTVRGSKGRITSPGFPGGFNPNYRCTYQIFRPDPSICQIELEFFTFSLGKHNPPGCSTGAFLELPGKHRLCHDMNGKMILRVSQFKEPVIFYFESDSLSSGRGFDIELNQLPYTCPGYARSDTPFQSEKRCYQEITSHTGHFSSSDIQPNLPLEMPMWCEFVVRRADPTVCKVKLQISSKNYIDLPCTNDFISLPNTEKMCISVQEKRELRIPRGSNYITLVYYNTHNPEFNLFVEQVTNSCEPETHHRNESERRRGAWEFFYR